MATTTVAPVAMETALEAEMIDVKSEELDEIADFLLQNDEKNDTTRTL